MADLSPAGLRIATAGTTVTAWSRSSTGQEPLNSRNEARQCGLDQLQRWMQAVITHPDGIASGIAADTAQHELPLQSADIEMVIGRSAALGSVERLAVYGNAYFARLVECLGDCFPAVKHALGENAFGGFAVAYLQRHPSQSYTLDDLGRHFSAWLRETRPEDVAAPGWPDFLIDLAMYEATCNDVFDGPGIEGQTPLDADRLACVAPDDVPRIVLHPAPCLRLLELQFSVHEYVTAVRRDQQPDYPAPAETLLVVTRRDFIVRRGAVSRPEFLLLAALIDGRPLGSAIETAVEATASDVDAFAAQLSSWFQHWAAAEWFVGFEVVDATGAGTL